MTTTTWIALCNLSQWETHDIPTPPKITFVALKHAFLAQEWSFFYIMENKLDYVHLKDFLNYECESHLKQPLAPPQRIIIVAYHTPNHRFVEEIDWWLTIAILRDHTLC